MIADISVDSDAARLLIGRTETGLTAFVRESDRKEP